MSRMTAVNTALLNKLVEALDSEDDDDEVFRRLINVGLALAASRKPIPEPEAKP